MVLESETDVLPSELEVARVASDAVGRGGSGSNTSVTALAAAGEEADGMAGDSNIAVSAEMRCEAESGVESASTASDEPTETHASCESTEEMQTSRELAHEMHACKQQCKPRASGISARMPGAAWLLLTAAAVASLYELPTVQPGGVALGTHDPHCLRIDERSSCSVRRAPTFSTWTHEPAVAAELRQRPLPQLNQPTPAASMPPPPEPPTEPPRFTSVEQVVPRRTLTIVHTWHRRLRRCLRAATDGKLRLARKLRPPDLWLPAEQHTTKEALPFNIDLRPLSRGEPTRTLDACDVSTDLNMKAVIAAEARGDYVDAAILQEMQRGISDDVEGPRGTMLCGPHVGALANYAAARSKLDKSLQRGWASEHALPCWPLHACPYNIVDESSPGAPKYRLTNDYSWPPPGRLPDGEGGHIQSSNAAMDRSSWPDGRMLKVAQYAESVAVLRTCDAPVRVWSADCEAFYRVMGRRPEEMWRNAMAVSDGFQLDERCCFGSAADATKCVRVSNFLAWEARAAMQRVDELHPPRDERVLEWLTERRGAAAAAGVTGTPEEARYTALHVFGMYVDDGLGGSIDDALYDIDGAPVLNESGEHVRRATAHFEALRATLLRYGHRSAPDKEQPPSTQLIALGVCVDVQLDRLFLTEAKRSRYTEAIDEVCRSATVDRQALLRLLGRLQFAASCYPAGRQWLHPAWRLVRASFRTHADSVIITRAVRDALARWRAAIQEGGEATSGVPLASPLGMAAAGSPGVGVIYADASGEYGYGAWTVVGDEVWVVRGTWSAHERAAFIIADKELFASTIGVVTFTEAAAWRDVYSFTDNTVAMSAMRKLTPTSPAMQQLTAARVEWMLERGVREAAERVSSKSNLWADLLSREGGWAPFSLQVAALGLQLREMQPPTDWQRLRRFSVPTEPAKAEAKLAAAEHVTESSRACITVS